MKIQEVASRGSVMQTLYKPKAYSDQIRTAVLQSGPMGIALANRWMLRWPEAVSKLIQASEYLAAFQEQLEQEKTALAGAYNMTHLTPTEQMQVEGLAQSPPMI